MVENIVIGKILINEQELLAFDKNDWINVEKEKTAYTNERYLPRILADFKIMKSSSEVRRNRKDLDIQLNKLDFMQIKIGKKFVFIIVGE